MCAVGSPTYFFGKLSAARQLFIYCQFLPLAIYKRRCGKSSKNSTPAHSGLPATTATSTISHPADSNEPKPGACGGAQKGFILKSQIFALSEGVRIVLQRIKTQTYGTAHALT
jgi:hypothetical protein